MPMTATLKLLARAAGLEGLVPGRLFTCPVDWVLGNDITGPAAIEIFERAGFDRVFDREKIILVPDHFAPCKDIASAELCRRMRHFARSQGITHYYEVGQAGIEHALVPEKGLCAPGEVIIGADSHTCTYGAVGAFATGIGSTDMAAAMATGQCWFKAPEVIRVILRGRPGPYVTGKDVILHLIGLIGVDGARYMSLEFEGEGVAALSMDSRFTLCNMAIEAGAKSALFPVDDICRAYLAGRVERPWEAVTADAGAVYAQTLTLELSAIPPTVALPHLPSNTCPAAECGAIAVDQVVIGSCTNGRLEDLRMAAAVLKGRRVAPGLRLIVIPATQQIYLEAMAEGLVETFIKAGGVVSLPTCGPCLGGYLGILGPGETCVSTTNRNFVGRMGHKDSRVILASPAVAAASALKGYVGVP